MGEANPACAGRAGSKPPVGFSISTFQIEPIFVGIKSAPGVCCPTSSLVHTGI